MDILEWLAEQKIRKAQQDGEFDRLQGKGKPLHLEDLTFEPEELRSAHKILRNNDLAPAWILLGQEIDHEIAAARRQLEQDYAPANSQAQRHQGVQRFSEALGKINRRILEYNLRTPAPAFERSPLRLSTELARLSDASLF
ncbi:MAG: DUF1992 domain-containing protein [Chloroflexi bacterium]|nr:DUF1992 domain-containing protein [Anaerolineaceae bacterium]NMB88128.1 DUF1992 domain-containing protein [Chloroflexota bacterium]